MEELFQHLQPPAAPEQTQGQQLAALEDLDRHYGQGHLRHLVCDVTGRRVVAKSSLLRGGVDVEPYNRFYPRTKVSAASESAVNHRTSSLVARLDDMTPGVMVPIMRRTTGSQYQHVFVIGHAAGVALENPFQVVWLGSNRWRVNAGEISGGGLGQTAFIPGADLTGSAGFIGFYLGLNPVINIGFPTRISWSAGGLVFTSTFGNRPPVRTLGNPTSNLPTAWTSGTVFVPLAHVEAPTASARPSIRQIRSGNLRVPDSYGPGPGFPGVSS